MKLNLLATEQSRKADTGPMLLRAHVKIMEKLAATVRPLRFARTREDV